MAQHWPVGRNKAQAGLALGFRSGLEEANAAHLRAHGVTVHFETFKIKYAIPITWHTYTPDFPLDNGIIVETKGRWLMADRAKMLFVRSQYPDLDIRMVFSRGKAPISTGAKTTCAQWAEKHGMIWAEKLIPIAWTKEKGPKVKPADALKLGPVGFRELMKAEGRAG